MLIIYRDYLNSKSNYFNRDFISYILPATLNKTGNKFMF